VTNNELDYRRKALEDAFFTKRDQELLEKLRERQDHEDSKEMLSRLAGTVDDAILDRILLVGIRPETYAALAYIPMIVVAWADGVLDLKERKAVLETAEQAGVAPGSPGYVLLQGWLDQEPPGNLLEAWKAYTAALCQGLEAPEREKLRDHVLEGARKVGNAAGGILGMGAISKREKVVIKELASVFETPAK
jgi:hypothetical protein